jgi:hypothetical protein
VPSRYADQPLYGEGALWYLVPEILPIGLGACSMLAVGGRPALARLRESVPLSLVFRDSRPVALFTCAVRKAACFIAILLATASLASAQTSSYFGDVDANGVIDAKDAMYAYFYVNGFATLPADWTTRLDVDHNGVIDGRDAARIRWAATELVATPPFDQTDASTTIVTSVDPRYGPAGTRVTIQGDHFRPGNTTVRLGSTDLILLSVQTNRIVAQIPSAAVSGYITVRVGTGLPTLGVPFVVGPLPVPQYPSPTLAYGQVGFGDPVWMPQSPGDLRGALGIPILLRCDPTNVGAVQVLVLYDPTILQGLSVGPGVASPLGSTNTSYCIDNVHGGVSLVRLLDHAPLPPSGTDSVIQVGTLFVQVIRWNVTTTVAGLSLVTSDPAVPCADIGGRPHPEFAQSKRLRF